MVCIGTHLRAPQQQGHIMNTLRTLSPIASIALIAIYSIIGMSTAGAGLAAASPLLIVAIALPIVLDRTAASNDS